MNINGADVKDNHGSTMKLG